MEHKETCPYCGEIFVVEESREMVFCPCCGKKIQLNEFIEVTCPECHHRVTIRPNRTVVYCQDCGAKMIFEENADDGQLTEKERTAIGLVDEALDRRHQLQMEKIKERAIKSKNPESSIVKIVRSIVRLIVFVFIFLLIYAWMEYWIPMYFW